MRRTVGLIWAQTPTGVIGNEGALPWRLPEDLAHFKATTLGYPVLMGRKTWDSLPERYRPLPQRRNVVITRNSTWQAEGVERAEGLQAALAMTDPDPIWIIGGGEIYRAAMRFATTIAVTEVDLHVEGDTSAPEIPPDWPVDTSDWHTSNNGIRYRFRTYSRP